VALRRHLGITSSADPPDAPALEHRRRRHRGIFVLVFYVRAGSMAVSDWDATWVGARALLQGRSPYAVITMPPWPWHLNYPLPGVILSIPFTVLPLHLARAAFVAVGTAVFTFVVTREHYWTLYFVFSGAMLASWAPVQWAPLLVAATLAPSLGWMLAAKPTAGFALWVAWPRRVALIGGIALVLVSLAIQPGWIAEWLHGVSGNPHRPPLVRPGGVLLLLGLLRWRRPEGRLLVALCIDAAERRRCTKRCRSSC
jgi:hypothetical protein